MNILDNINAILKAGENERLEFKTSFNTETIETLAASANFKGGAVFIGVSDIGEFKGVSVNPESIQLWINEIKSKTEPSIITGQVHEIN